MLRERACRCDRARSALDYKSTYFKVENNAVVILLLTYKLTFVVCCTRFGFHRMSSSCARGATASGGVTFIRSTVLKTMRKENLLDMRKLYVTTLKGAVRPITTASMPLQHPARIK